MDDAHRLQAGLVDALERAICERAGDEKVQELLLQLVERTSDHFAAEQDLMRASAYPAYKAHVEEHDRLLQHVSMLLASHAAGRRQLTLEVARSLRPWLRGHIEGRDRALAEYLRPAARCPDSRGAKEKESGCV